MNIFYFSKIGERKFLYSMSKFVICISIFCNSCHAASPKNKKKPYSQIISTQIKPSAQINILSQFMGQEVNILGFFDKNSVILTHWDSNANDEGHIIRWNIYKNKSVAKEPLSKWLDSNLCLSSNGKTLTTTNVRESRAFEEVKAYRITTLRCSDLKVTHSINIAANDDIVGFLPLNEKFPYVIGKTFSQIRQGKDLIGGRDRLSWFNTQTGKFEKTLSYSPTPECDALKISPDRSFLISFFYSEAFDPNGESDYASLKNKIERQGFVDVISPKTGKILWHIEPSKQQPVGDPLFFISPTRFISSDTVFNIATKTARPWNAITPTRKCLAAVPNHPECALFLTPSGLQLRNWQKDKLLVSWPRIKSLGRFMFSPDLKMFSFKRDSIIQFWKFDPKWLK